jgi:hypothetical protein
MIYITRDLFAEGGMSPYVDVWAEKPIRLKDFDGVGSDVWVSDETEWTKNKLTTITVTECRDLYGTIPDFVDQLIQTTRYRLPQCERGF